MPYVPALDGIRGLAILLVVLCHCTLFGGLYADNLGAKVFRAASTAGWTGVDLFFVLSGFLITGILYDARGGRRFFRNFYARRVLRIFPLYYGVLAIFFLFIPALHETSPQYDTLLTEQAWYWTYLANIRIAVTGWPEHVSLGHFWSLAVEEQFYLIWPVVVFFSSRRTLLRVCGVCIFGGLAVRLLLAWSGYGLGAYVLAPARMDALALGGVLAVTARSPGGLAVWRQHAWWVAGISAALLVLAVAWQQKKLIPEDPVIYTVGFSIIALFYGSLLTLVVTARGGSVLDSVFKSAPLTLLGRYSYGLYVFHLPIMGALRRQGVTSAWFSPMLGSHTAGYMAYVVVAAGGALLLAALSWHLYEARFLELKKMFTYTPADAAAGDDAAAVSGVAGRAEAERSAVG